MIVSRDYTGSTGGDHKWEFKKEFKEIEVISKKKRTPKCSSLSWPATFGKFHPLGAQ